MRILSHYFVARFLGLFSTVLAAAVILLVTIEMVLNLDDMASFTSAGADASENPSAFRYLWVRLASYYLADLVPIAAFIAVFIAFAWAGRSMELIAIQAGGIRILRVIVPVLGTALILSCATAILHETLILRAQQIWSAEARGDRHEIDFGRRAFWHQRGRAITNIAEADPTTRTLHGVEIFERGLTGTVVRVIRTDYVRIGADGSWQIEDAAIWSFDPDDPALAPQLEEHVSMTLELDTLRGEELLGADAGLLPLPILARYLGREPVEETSSNLRRLTRRYHERLSGPWLVLCFALLALPFALRVGPEGGIARPAVEGIAAVSIFFLLRSAGETLAQEELFPLGITPWLTMGLFAASSLWLLRRRAV